ncbi:MAG: multicopper oxidase domain-containing protein, partial [Anaerolineales bacterium]
MHTSKFKWIRLAIMLVMGLLAMNLFASVQSVKAAGPTTGIICTEGPSFNLTAQSGYIQMSDMNTVYMWSYGTGITSGNFQYPGPVLCVNEGDTVEITLKNELPYNLPTSLIFPGQENVMADGVLAQPDLANDSLTNSVANGGSITYSFIASRPGTFIYESGTDTKTQVTMGLASVLIVRPSMGANFVYNRATDQFTPEEEFMAFLSEVDPYQHAAWERSVGKGRNYNLNNYHAYYWLLNGRGFPDTMADNNASWMPNQPYGALAHIHPFNDTVASSDPAYHPYPAVERFINVGTEEYPFHPHGQNGSVVGRDGYPLAGPGGEDMSF